MEIPLIYDLDVGDGTLATSPLRIPRGLVHALKLSIREDDVVRLLVSAWTLKLQIFNPADIDWATRERRLASVETSLVGANNDMVFTSKVQGDAGNDISVEYIHPGSISQPISVDVTGSAIVVSLATNGGGVITSTAAQVKTAIEADADANALVTVTNKAGNSGAGVVPVMAEIFLEGANDPLAEITGWAENTDDERYEKNFNFGRGVMGVCRLPTVAGRIVHTESGGAENLGEFFIFSYAGVITAERQDSDFNGIVDRAAVADTVPFAGIQDLPAQLANYENLPSTDGMGAVGPQAFYLGDLATDDSFGVLSFPSGIARTLLGVNYDLGVAATGSDITLVLKNASDVTVATFTIPEDSLRGYLALSPTPDLTAGVSYYWKMTAVGSTVAGSRLAVTPWIKQTA